MYVCGNQLNVRINLPKVEIILSPRVEILIFGFGIFISVSYEMPFINVFTFFSM